MNVQVPIPSNFANKAKQLATILALCLLSVCAHAQPQVNANTALNALLQAPQEPLQQWFASTDPQHKNQDYVLVPPGKTVVVDLAPGNLERLWSTSSDPNQLDLTLVAGARRLNPLIENGVAQIGLLDSKAFTLTPDLKYPAVRELGKGAQLAATNRANEPIKWFYQVAIRPAIQKPLPVLPAVSEVSKRQFKLDLKPGQTGIINNWQQPGLIYELSVALNEGSAKGVFEKLRLKCEWDGQVGVDVPMMSLAGQVAGDQFISNAICDYDGARLLLRWPMPFKTATLSLVNGTDRELNLDVQARVQTYDAEPSPYRFCAVERSATPVAGQPVSILDVKGQGAFAGLALDIKAGPDSTRRIYGFLEGNEIISADGEKLEGTGTEDYFSSAWYFPDKPFFHPYEGLTKKVAPATDPTDADVNPLEIAAYRFHIPDAIPFRRELKFDFEHGNGNNAPDMKWTWVAFWYQLPPLTVTTEKTGDAGAITSASGGSDYDTPVVGNDKWKLWIAVGAGVFLGIVMAISRRIVKKRVG